MNVNDIYDIMPEDQHGIIAVSAGAVTITQDGDNPPFVLLKATPADNSEIVFSAADLPSEEPPTPIPTPAPAPVLESHPVSEPAPVSVVIPEPVPEPAPKLSVIQRLVKWFTR